MHDWILHSVTVHWETGETTLQLSWSARRYELKAHGMTDLKMPRSFAWGPSSSVNSANAPTPNADGTATLKVEMQSGDSIEIVAKSFSLPA